MDFFLPEAPYYVCSIAMLLAAITHIVAVWKRQRAPYYTYKVIGSSAWALGFLLLAITAAPHHSLRAEAAILIRSLFLAGGVLQLLWIVIFARAMVGVRK
jgi:hypothetical protein